MIDPNGLQSNPSWVITFLRFSNRHPKVLGTTAGRAEETRKPLVVINDCLSVTTSNSKGSANGSCTMVFKTGDINYMTAIVPGDYFTVNMVNSELKAEEIYKRVLGVKEAGPSNINTYEDGFRGVFRVQSVHKTLSVIDASKGTKSVSVTITGYSFSEMNDVIYFNPYLVTAAEKSNDILFLSGIGNQWNKIIGLKNNNNSVQDLIILLFQMFLGRGINEEGKKLKDGLVRTENNLYFLPEGLGRLLGHPKARFVADLVNLVCGIQKYAKTTPNKLEKDILNPVNIKENGRVYAADLKVRGVSYAKPEYWNQIRVWDILNSYLNPVVNEMYTAFRADPVTGNIMPTLVIRQKPFTTDHFIKSNPGVSVTSFRSLPRWMPDADEVLDFHIGRDDGARINFVQIFGRSQTLQGGTSADVDQQIALKNYDIDREDIKRSGLKPLITSSNYDYAASDINKRLSEAPLWAKLVGDWVIGGHLKLSGSITLKGYQYPIEVGDNLLFDDILFHIEGVQHVAQLDGRGNRSFRTTLQLSSGISVENKAGATELAEMQHTDADLQRESKLEAGEFEIIEPGISDSQDLPLASNRSKGEKTAPNPENSFDPIKKTSSTGNEVLTKPSKKKGKK